MCEQTIAANLERIRANIVGQAGGRQVDLVCVTKYAEDGWTRALLRAGADNLGENRLPDAVEKFERLEAEGFRFRRHLIGAQQSRKLKLLPGSIDLMHAIDRWKTAEVLNQHLVDAGKSMDCLLQVNIGEEVQKSGVARAEAEEVFLRITEECPAMQMRGLMAIPPGPAMYPGAREFELCTRSHFDAMFLLFDRMRKSGTGPFPVDTLSLGMSQDYLWAVAAGATLVRVGSALFEGLEGMR